MNLESVDRLPLFLAGMIVVLGVMTLGNTLVTSVTRRRRDPRDLEGDRLRAPAGRCRRGLAGDVFFALLALLVGMPIGIKGGRWAWSAVASGIGSSSPPIVPVLAVALIVPGTLVAANVIAAWPT